MTPANPALASAAWWVWLTAIAVATGLMLVLGTRLWQRMMRNKPRKVGVRCAFSPRQVKLRGRHGDVLSTYVQIEGPQGLAFTTFSEEPWVVVTPASGMTPETVGIALHTAHAPTTKQQNLIIRLFPADFNLAADELHVHLNLKLPRETRLAAKSAR